jgi:beta-N-acetylhexosaminidase
VAASAKHFPGLANTPVDTHVAQAVISGSLDYLWERDLVPFRAAVEAGTATVMVSHVTFEALDAEHPATLSPQVIQGLLRDEIGFSGLACTDCMEMRAISDHYTPGESAVLAALAGQDLILFSHRPDRQAAAYDALVAAARSGRLPEAQIDAAVARVQAVKERFAITAAPDPGQVRQPERLAVMQDAARRGMVTLRLQPGVLPLRPDDTRRVALIEFASILESGILESGGVTGFASAVRERLPGVERVSLGGAENPPDLLARARALAAGADVLVLATRNAHLMPTQRALAQALIDLAPRTILLCLRNPYDADALTGAGTVLCTCGDSTPSLQTAVDALLGTFVPLGRLPVSVRTGGVA